MRTRRYFISGRLYEATIRVREGLPFPPLRLINTIIEGILARVQRDDKITLCHYLWMGNHAHFLFVVRDAQKCSDFFAELQKQVTEAIKKLLGLRQLNLWEGSPSIAIILDLEKAIERLRYLYSNPARAHLVDSVADYPGLNSFRAFQASEPTIKWEATKLVPWVRTRHLPRLRQRRVSPSQDICVTEEILNHRHKRHTLAVTPHAWLEAFNITDCERIRRIKERTLASIEDLEQDYKSERASTNRRALGARALSDFAVLAPHTPQTRSRRIYVLSSLVDLRLQHIRLMKQMVGLCRELYEKLRQGAHVLWPPGVFPPRCPPLANAITPY